MAHNYTREKQQQKSPKARAANASRKRARRKMGSCNGEVDHKDGNPNNNAKSNLRCISRKANRSDGASKVPKSAAAKGGRRSHGGGRPKGSKNKA
jgi:hypothetical protein